MDAIGYIAWFPERRQLYLHVLWVLREGVGAERGLAQEPESPLRPHYTRTSAEALAEFQCFSQLRSVAAGKAS